MNNLNKENEVFLYFQYITSQLEQSGQQTVGSGVFLGFHGSSIPLTKLSGFFRFLPYHNRLETGGELKEKIRWLPFIIQILGSWKETIGTVFISDGFCTSKFRTKSYPRIRLTSRQFLSSEAVYGNDNHNQHTSQLAYQKQIWKTRYGSYPTDSELLTRLTLAAKHSNKMRFRA